MTFHTHTCPHCRGVGLIEKPASPMADEECFVLYRQYGLHKRCLRADAGYARQCDQPWPGVPRAPDGLCPIAAVEDRRRREDEFIQRYKRKGLEGLRIEDR